MASLADHGGDDVSVGRVFNRAFGTIGAHPVATLGLAFVFSTLPSLIFYAALPLLLPQVGIGWTVVAAVGAGAISMGFAALVQGSLTLTVLFRAEGREADIGDTLPPALMRFVPLLLLGLLIGFGFMFGLVLLIIPGILLNVMWWVAVPAMVAERLSLADALGRSVSLTEGARWMVFGAELALGIGSFLVNAALKALGLAWTPGLFANATLALHGASVLPFLLYVLVQTIGMAVYAATHAAFYVELRNWKDGPPTHALAEVFG